MVWLKHQSLQYYAYHEEANRRSEHLGYEEKPGSGAICVVSEAFFKVTVYRHQIFLVENRHEHCGYEEISHDETEYHLQV